MRQNLSLYIKLMCLTHILHILADYFQKLVIVFETGLCQVIRHIVSAHVCYRLSSGFNFPTACRKNTSCYINNRNEPYFELNYLQTQEWQHKHIFSAVDTD